MQHPLSGDRLWRQYTAITTRCPDRWQLVQHLVTDGTREGKTLRRGGPFTHIRTGHMLL